MKQYNKHITTTKTQRTISITTTTTILVEDNLDQYYSDSHTTRSLFRSCRPRLFIIIVVIVVIVV